MMGRKSLLGRAMSMIMLIIVIGFFVAVYREYDGDILASVEKVVNIIWNAISNVADIFGKNRTFRQVVNLISFF